METSSRGSLGYRSGELLFILFFWVESSSTFLTIILHMTSEKYLSSTQFIPQKLQNISHFITERFLFKDKVPPPPTFPLAAWPCRVVLKDCVGVYVWGREQVQAEATKWRCGRSARWSSTCESHCIKRNGTSKGKR